MKKRWLIGTAVVAAVVAGTAYATIPGTNGTVSGCYEKYTGLLRVIDAESGKSCTKLENPIAWSQRGPKGDTGPQGPAGPQGTPGPAGAAGTTFGTGAGLELLTLTGPFGGNLLQLEQGYRLPQGCTAGQVPQRAGGGWVCSSGGGGGAAASRVYIDKGRSADLGNEVLASLSLEPGTYLVIGKASVRNHDSDEQDAGCSLSTGDFSTVRLGSAGIQLEANEQTITVLDAVTLGDTTTVELRCGTFDGYGAGRLTAVSVGALVAQ